MEYITVKEAASKWGISERLTQQYCTSGRIEGVAKFGGAWAIPENAKKPSDPRRVVSNAKTKDFNQKRDNKASKVDSYMAMPLINTPFELGHCRESIAKIEDLDTRTIALSEYYYFSGQAEQASDLAERYLTSENIAFCLSACWLFGYSNLALNRIDRARWAIEHVKEDTLSN